MSEVYLEVEGQRINGFAMVGNNNKIVVTPQSVWAWPFEWENLDDYLEHYKIEQELVKMGINEDDFVNGYQDPEGVVKLYDWRIEPPVWLGDVVDNNFPGQRVYVNDILFR